MHLISGETISQVVLNAYNEILSKGHYRASRNGGCTSIFDATFEIKNPRSRHLYLAGRKSNIYAMIAETFWVMAGDDKVHPYLSFFLPRAPDYSDDGVRWSGAYGPRLYAENQLASMLDLFKRDGLYTRRAYTAIHDMHQDSTWAIEDKFGFGELGKDRPCNLGINFYVEGDTQFCAKVIQRSGDIIFGTGSINPFEFSFLHELMYNEVKKDYPDLELGSYRWHVTNAHLYDFSKDQAVNALSANRGVDNAQNHSPLIGPSIDKWQSFFADLISLYTEAITTDDPQYVISGLIPNLGHSFVAYDVPFEDNLLWDYAKLVAFYIASKRQVDIGAFDATKLSQETFYPIALSNFTKFKFKR